MTASATALAGVRFPAAVLIEFAAALFAKAGLDAEKAEATARLLVTTDMMRRYTHGLAQASAYLDEIAGGRMATTGDPEMVRDFGSTAVWDGRYLPGLWLCERAIEEGIGRVGKHGVVTYAIRRSHHMGCLAALAKLAADRGLVAIIASSGPHASFAAPFGGKAPLFTPDPFAIGYPTSTHPVLVDISATLTSVAMTREKAAAGVLYDHPWLADAEGKPTRDPSVLEKKTPPGTLLFIGGAEAGHKGYGLALMVEALTQGLAGHGRRDKPTNWGGGVFIQLLDPELFAGRDAFVEQMDFIKDLCHANPPIDPARPVRLPGEQACAHLDEATRNGVLMRPSTIATLRERAAALGVDARALG